MIPVYYILICLAHITALPFIVILSLKTKYKCSLKARFLFPKNHSKERYDFWLHACSLGEVNSLAPIIDSISAYQRIFISVITNTGFAQAHKLFGTKENVCIEYLPFESFLPFVAPTCKKLLVFEAELWLMLFYYAKKTNAHTKLVNARISRRSFKRYLQLKTFYRSLFFYVDSILAQSARDAARLQRLCAKNINVIGNIKILTPIQPTALYIKPKRLIVLAASTHAKEEEVILESFRKFHAQYHQPTKDSKQHKTFTPHNVYHDTMSQQYQENPALQCPYNAFIESSNPLLIIAPRHPERFELVYNLCLKQFETTRWSNLHVDSIDNYKTQTLNNPQCINHSSFLDDLHSPVLLIDTLGELINLYAISDIVILGGSFESIGGHNPLEPAMFHNILISGKEIFNQHTLFACIQNYYLIDSNELPDILLDYQNLHHSHINTQTINNMLQAILA
ncbi:3-deoxy-D-manno-octulosonic acid transferase [Helicobacter aurati]|uniref:3-deoxy-D-manno-octulosonic acid transferase n=1 Tax=Helicobacter aurati TaxID=137778 RepID=A0A3D8J0F0_9HELI|nr:3-deoxy-D-manno-octulosonic acid transferase [Helicobacter aurati]RDU70635.1 3-deoxy-D-manno-octulosonic acid transferase [Helicobacter aurati]